MSLVANGQFYEEYCRQHPERAFIVKYEELMENPFQTSNNIYKKLSLTPSDLDQIRIAVKPTIKSMDQTNNTKKNKIWIRRDNYHEVLDNNINSLQIKKLSRKEIDIFIKANSSIMSKYGYEVDYEANN